MEFSLFISHLALFFIAFSSNFLSALAGGGAGLIQLPALVFLGLPFSIALATHKVASVALGIGASIRFIQNKRLKPFLVIFVLLCGLPGVILGASFVRIVPDKICFILLGFLTFIIGIYSSANPDIGVNYNSGYINRSKLLFGGCILFLIGFLNGSLSSGTGLFVTIWLVKWFKLPYTTAVGYTLVLVGLFWNGTGAFVLGKSGDIKWEWMPILLSGAILGGYLGAHLSIIKGNRFVKKIFEILSILVGFSLVSRAFL